MKDLTTGKMLASGDEEICEAKITEVKAEFCIAKFKKEAHAFQNTA